MKLLLELPKIPQKWSLTALGANKAPYLPGWQDKRLSRAEIEAEIKSRRAKAIGCLCGEPSGGLLFVDCDGSSAGALLRQILGGDPPITAAVTSGREGRQQLIFQVEESDFSRIRTKKIKAGAGKDGKPEMLEFRWNGCQSAIAGAHPTTEGYRWINSPDEVEIAIAPPALIEKMLIEQPSQPEIDFAPRAYDGSAIPLERCLSLSDRALIESGSGEGSRDNDGAKLARGLIGAGRYLASSGIAFDGDPRSLLEEYCSKCSPPLSSKDCERIWRSAEKANPKSSLSPDAIENCIKRWERENRRILGKQAKEERAIELSAKSAPRSQIDEIGDRDWQEWKRLNSLNPNFKIENSEPFFDFIAPQKGEIQAIKAPLGSGKTHWFLRVISQLNIGAIIISNLNSSLLDISERARKMGIAAYHYQSEVKNDETLKGLQRSSSSVILMCPDSLLSLSPEDFDGKLLIIDEVESVRQAFTIGATHIASNRKKITERFQIGISRAHASVFLDGLLSNQSIDWIKSLAGDKPISIIEKSLLKPREINVIEGAVAKSGDLIDSPNGLISHILSLPPEENIIIASDSRKLTEMLYRKLSEQRGRGIIINAKRINEDELAQSFVRDHQDCISKHQPKFVIFSPSIGPAFDISIKDYFSHFFCIYRGVVRPLQIIQQMGRSRDPKTKLWLYVPQKGMEKQSLSPALRLYSKMPWLPKLGDEARINMRGEIEKYLIESYQSGDANFNRLSRDFISAALSNQSDAILREIQCDLFERANLRKCTLELLKNHDLQYSSLQDSLDKNEWKALKFSIEMEESEAIFNSEDIDIEEARKIEDFHRKIAMPLPLKEERAIAKAKLKDRLPGIEQAECWDENFIHLVKFSDRGYIAKATGRYGLANPEKIEQWEKAHWKQRLRDFCEGMEGSFEAANYRSLWAKIRAFKAIRLDRFLTPGFTWGKDSDEVRSLFAACKPIAIQRALGITRGSDPMALIGRLLKMIHGGTESKQIGSGKNRQRIYSISPDSFSDPVLCAVLECLDRKYSEPVIDVSLEGLQCPSEEHESVGFAPDEAIEMPDSEREMLEDEARSQPPEFAEQHYQDNFTNEVNSAMDNQKIPVASDVKVAIAAYDRINSIRFKMPKDEYIAIRNRFGASLNGMSDENLCALADELEALQIA